MASNGKQPAGAIATRWVEIGVAVALVVVGAIVILDSHRVGVGWAPDGPRSGYFPNIIGWILAAVGAWIVGETVYRWKSLESKVFVEREQLKPVLQMLLPTIAYVALVALIGIYVASMIYIGAFMRVQGRFGWLKSLAVAIAVPVAIFLLFEIWFLVPLPKGPVENLLGY
ncbi:MAG: tripartite tricarboxylate transporter TctB family protein [Burkholderiales bacterium]|nr:tripartite tricarboxylate transporter TctB family protein [Burkholderiales bacterium]